MDATAIEKITFLGALLVAVVYLWRAYSAARDETIAALRDEIKRLQEARGGDDDKQGTI